MLLCFVAPAGAQPQPRSPTPPKPDLYGWPAFTNDIARHLELGVRYTSFAIDTAHRSYFLGSIDELKEEQGRIPLLFFVRWFFSRFFGVEIGEDRVQGRTFTNTADNHTDGAFKMDGPVLSVIARARLSEILQAAYVLATADREATVECPVAERLTPYVGLGCVFYNASFDNEPWWHYGYNSPSHWEELGEPMTPYQNKTRTIEAAPSDGTAITLGCAARLWGRWSADLNWTHYDANLHARYYLYDELRSTKDIPMSHSSVGLGLRYSF